MRFIPCSNWLCPKSPIVITLESKTLRRQLSGCLQCRRSSFCCPRDRRPSPPPHKRTAGHSPLVPCCVNQIRVASDKLMVFLLKVFLEDFFDTLVARSNIPLDHCFWGALSHLSGKCKDIWDISGIYLGCAKTYLKNVRLLELQLLLTSTFTPL